MHLILAKHYSTFCVAPPILTDLLVQSGDFLEVLKNHKTQSAELKT